MNPLFFFPLLTAQFMSHGKNSNAIHLKYSMREYYTIKHQLVLMLNEWERYFNEYKITFSYNFEHIIITPLCRVLPKIINFFLLKVLIKKFHFKKLTIFSFAHIVFHPQHIVSMHRSRKKINVLALAHTQ